MKLVRATLVFVIGMALASPAAAHKLRSAQLDQCVSDPERCEACEHSCEAPFSACIGDPRGRADRSCDRELFMCMDRCQSDPAAGCC